MRCPPAERVRWERERGTLRSRLDPARNWNSRFSESLDAGWRFAEPENIRWPQSTGGLTLDFVDRSPRPGTAWRPFRYDGGPLTLEVDLTAERLEWGGGISENLRTDDGQLLGITTQGWGGQSPLHQLVGCHSTNILPSEPFRVDSPEVRRRHVIRLDVFENGDHRCTVSDGDSGEVLKELSWDEPPPRPGIRRLELNDTYASWSGPMRARATLHSIRLSGVQLLEPASPETSWDQALRALVNGDPDRALALVKAGAGTVNLIELSLFRSRALQDLGRPLETEAALHAALEAGFTRHPAFRERLLALVRGPPEQLNPVLQKTLGWFRLSFD